MTVLGLLLMAALIIRLWPDTGFAKLLRHTLVERPLAFISRIRRVHFVFLVVGFGVIYSFSMAGMPHLGVAAAMDVSIFVDAMITASTIAALNRTRGAWMAVAAWLPGLRRAAARPRRKRSVPVARKPAANDDDGHGDRALAA